jgi:hypothetical protein
MAETIGEKSRSVKQKMSQEVAEYEENLDSFGDLGEKSQR